MLGTPPAFVLSQDQTLKKLYLNRFRSSNQFLNNLLLAIYSRIFVGCFFAYALNKSINLSKVFCSSLCYSIYKVQCSLPALAVSFYILAHRFPFVKNFFQVFSNRFFCLSSASGAVPQALRYNNRHNPLCQLLFCFFSGLLHAFYKLWSQGAL